jgi:hypothetical protein
MSLLTPLSLEHFVVPACLPACLPACPMLCLPMRSPTLYCPEDFGYCFDPVPEQYRVHPGSERGFCWCHALQQQRHGSYQIQHEGGLPRTYAHEDMTQPWCAAASGGVARLSHTVGGGWAGWRVLAGQVLCTRAGCTQVATPMHTSSWWFSTLHLP